MEQAQIRLTYLLDKYLSGTATVADMREFWELMQASDSVAGIESQVWNYWQQVSSADDTGAAPEIFAVIKDRARDWEQLDSFRHRQRRRRSFIVYTSVAAMLIISVAIFIVTNNVAERWKPGKVVVETIAPGGAKAILTLADGTVVNLDDAKDGMVAREGAASIVKSGKGEILYTTGSNKIAAGMNKVATPRGGQYKIVLPDGTRVWLNAASSLEFPAVFVGKERKVTLNGEAYFEVASLKNMPFRVNHSNALIEVLGTGFNVKGYAEEGEVVTTLTEGSIAVKTAGSRSVLLKPGQQGVVSSDGGPVVLRDVNVQTYTSWKDGKFAFNGSLGAIMRDIARWYDVTVAFKGNAEQKVFAGTISRDKALSDVLAILESTMSVKFKVQGRQISVEPY